MLSQTRQDIADALNVGAFNVYAHRPKGPIKALDGWVIFRSMEPKDFGSYSITFGVVILLDSDQTLAEELLDANVQDLMDSVKNLPVISSTLQVGLPDDMYALILDLTLEVTP